MNRRAISIVLLGLLLISAFDAGRSKGLSWSKASKSRSRPQSRPAPQPSQTSHSSHAEPPAYGWKKDVQLSAPVNEHLSKSSATNVHSSYPGSHQTYPQNGYNPSGGYHPSGGYLAAGGYNPGVKQPYGGFFGSNNHGYNPLVGHGYNPSVGQGYNPSAGHGYNPSVGGGYNPPVGGGHVPVAAQPQTVIVQSQGSKPGIGQLAKEAFVYAGVSAGVNAAVNRILPGGIYGHSGGTSSGGTSNTGTVPVSETHITYYNYYNNDSEPVQANAQPANPAPMNPQPVAPLQGAPQGQPEGQPAPTPAPGQPQPNIGPVQPQYPPSPNGHVITNEELARQSEELYKADKNNANQHITMNLQGQKKNESATDDAPESLLTVKPEAYEIPTVKSVVALHDSYELDVKTKETVSSDDHKKESDLLDTFLSTDVMKAAMKYLADNGYVSESEYKWKGILERIWFSQFKRTESAEGSSGFETVYLAEQFGLEIIGLHNWIYYAKMEEAKKANYLGYIKEQKLGDKGAIVKIRSKLNDILQPVTTIFVGTSPELEMSLYTLCFYIRPNAACPVSMGGAQFIIVANRAKYLDEDILVSAYPDI